MEYKNIKHIKKEDLKALYEDAQWSGYTNNLDKLQRAVSNSNTVISAWDNKKLVGLVRTVSDNETVVFIQDILVLNEYKRKGIGKEFLKQILDKSKNIRQIVLITDAKDEASTSFYRSLKFKSCDDGEIVAYIYKK